MMYIHGMGHFHPENIIDNAFLEDLNIGTNHEWIMERVGIKTRRTVLHLDYLKETKNAQPQKSAESSLYTNAQLGAKAAEMAIQRAGLKSSDIGMVISGGCSAQNTIPAEACIIATELGLKVPAFDLNSGCSTFSFQIHFLRSMMPDSLPPYILVITPEGVTRCVDFRDRKAAVLFGDGAAAAVVSNNIPSRFAVVDSTVDSDPSGWDKIMIPTREHFVQDGQKVQMFAIKKTLSTLKKVRQKFTGNADELYFIGHQANLLVLQNVAEKAEIGTGRHLYNVDEYGNCGAAGAPCTFSQNWDRFKDGDHIAISVVGSGLSWGGLLIEVKDL